MDDKATDFEAWRQALAATVALARDIGCQPAVVQTLEAMIGNALREDWHDNGPYWMHMASDAPWNQAAREAVAGLAPAELAPFVVRVFGSHQRFEQLRATHLEPILLKRAWPQGSKRPGYERAAWSYVGWASGLAVRAALRRKPEASDDTAMLALHGLRRALLHWAADHVSEPDLPMKELLAWIAAHRFALPTQPASVVEQIARIIELVPAADAQDRKYTDHLLKSVASLREQFAQPTTMRDDAVAPRAEPYPAARFHRDWDALVRDEMKRLGFARIKGGASRWIKPVGERWLHVGFHPSKWGWSSHGGGSFHVSAELSATADPSAVDARDSLSLFATCSDAEFAPLLAQTALARDVVRRLSFADDFTRQLHESSVRMSARNENKRVVGQVHPDFEFYDPAELTAWAQALMPTFGAKLDRAVAAGP